MQCSMETEKISKKLYLRIIFSALSEISAAMVLDHRLLSIGDRRKSTTNNQRTTIHDHFQRVKNYSGSF